MSTKNLSKSVIAGGRSGYYKSEVARLACEERSAQRTYLRHIILNPEHDDDVVHPIRRPSNVDFKDKLNPIYRFLDSRVGQMWNDVRSELFTKFDIRTTPGRHVLFDHLLKSVSENADSDVDFLFKPYFVDACGRLCRRDSQANGRRVRRDGNKCKPINWVAIAAWLGNRKLGRCGDRHTWFVPTHRNARVRAMAERALTGPIIYAVLDENRDVIYDKPSPRVSGKYMFTPPPTIVAARVSFRQSRRLDEVEEAYFCKLPEDVRAKILAQAPANV